MSNQKHQQPNGGFGGYGTTPLNSQGAPPVPPYNRLAAAQAFSGSGLPHNAGFYQQNFMQRAQQQQGYMPMQRAQQQQGYMPPMHGHFGNIQQPYNPHPYNMSSVNHPVAQQQWHQQQWQKQQKQQQQQQQQQKQAIPPVQGATLPKTSETKAQANNNSQRISKPSNNVTSDKGNITKEASSKEAASKSLVPSNGNEKPASTPTVPLQPAGKLLEPRKQERKPARTMSNPQTEKNIPTIPATKSTESSNQEPKSSEWSALSPGTDNLPTVSRKRPAAKSLIRRRHHSTHDSIKRGIAQQKSMKLSNNPKKVPRKVVKPKKLVFKARSEDGPRMPPREIFSGPPDENIGEDGWPDGWTKKVFKRMGGSSKGHTDRYWYSPKIKFKLRSVVDVRRFLKAMKMTNGDEEESKLLYKKFKD